MAMKIADEYARITQILDEYRNLLDTIPEDVFTQTPPMGGWSYAEVYSHILQATLGAAISLEKCATGNCKATAKGPTIPGKLILLFGKFPPFRFKVPKSVEAKMPAQKMTKEDARNLIIKCRKRLESFIPLLHDAPKTSRMLHPRLGMLNGPQWFRFIRIHLGHHLKQITRIKKNLAGT